jgi:hypothetical protein
MKHINVFIGLPNVEDSKAVFRDIAPERMARAHKAGQVITDALNSSGLRLVNVGYPTQSDATLNQLDLATYQNVFWEAVGDDYQQISRDGELRLQAAYAGILRVEKRASRERQGRNGR